MLTPYTPAQAISLSGSQTAGSFSSLTLFLSPPDPKRTLKTAQTKQAP
jgi:hypothetical protein